MSYTIHPSEMRFGFYTPLGLDLDSRFKYSAEVKLKRCLEISRPCQKQSG